MKGLGMCIWSWPFTEQEVNAYKLIAYCSGSMSMTLPHTDRGFDDQPNLFFEYFDTYMRAKGEYQEAHRGADT